MLETLLDEANALKGDLTAWRHEFHQIPETDLDLPRTSAFVQQKLTEFGIPFKTLVDGNCVVGQLGHGSACIMLRADMDALPIEEASGEEFSSTNGNMHACGHDLHATALLGAAKLLKAHESELKGTVKLLFQPGEETFRGAGAAIEDGLMENPHVDAAFGMHVGSALPVGQVIYGHQCMTAVYGFRIEVVGKGGHGSSPEDCIDPINAAVHIHLALQELMSREKSPLTEASLTIGSFHAGTAPNIIPGTATLEGTLRVFDPEVRKFLIGRINEIVPAIAAAYRATATIEVLTDVPAVIADDDLTQACIGYMSAAIPDLQFTNNFHVMPSEDFALYGEYVPTSYMMVGARSEVDGVAYPHHNSKVRFLDDELPLGAASYAAVALGWTHDNGGEE